MDTYTMNKIKGLLRVLSGKAVLCAVLTLLFVAASAPLFAQTAEVRYAGVFYKAAQLNSNNEMYCDFSTTTTGTKSSACESKYLAAYDPAIYGAGGPDNTEGAVYTAPHKFDDGYFTVQLVEKGVTKTEEGEWPNSTWGNPAMRRENHSYNENGTAFFYTKYRSLNPEDPVKYDIYQVIGGESASCSSTTTSTGYTVDLSPTGDDQRSFVFTPNPTGNQNETDPWVSSGLIEYDQPYPSATPADNKYPNHCLALCMNVRCTNRPMSMSTYSIAFPIQQIKFDVVKYYNGKNIEDVEGTPSIRTINLFPDQDSKSAKCGSYRCPGSPDSGNTCPAPKYEERADGCYEISSGKQISTSKCSTLSVDKVYCEYEEGKAKGVCNYVIFNEDGQPSNKDIPFCAAWDGSYEIAGEFGKSNGDFGFRATVAGDVPGDKVTVENITYNSTIAYPGMNQIPIQVDVTNVHAVRSTPTVVGNITAVAAQPYTFAYRLSKDADVRVAIFDASSGDKAEYAGTGDKSNTGDPIKGENQIVRTLVDWQPRVGEGMKGVENDKQIVEFDSWDGRNNDGLLLPAGNYIAAIQAKTQDEWKGIDFSRAVTRQMSLDPLKLTDITVTGLNKKSTAYASINYVPTEPSKVYWEIYTPGTVFDKAASSTTTGINTNSADPTGTSPKIKNGTGSLVYRSVEDRTGRMNFNSRWDGLCGISAGTYLPYVIAKGMVYPPGAKEVDETTALTGTCATDGGCVYYLPSETGGCSRMYAYKEKMSNGEICNTVAGCPQAFAYGSPMPDGNYVYVLWAEIPYNGKYLNVLGAPDETGTGGTAGKKPQFIANEKCTGSAEINNQCFTGVKTLNYYTGQVAVERGLVDITIQPVSYATVGSSPTAYGLDPFIFKYSLARDASAVAKVTNSAGVDVKYLTPKDGVTQVAQQLNTLSWDGRDDQGRMVTPGTYMFVVESKDAMFPAVTNRASAVFPVDMYRVVDVSTTDVYGDSNAKATISYSLSKAMNAQINIYNKDVVIPAYNTASVGDYAGTSTDYSAVAYTGTTTTNGLSSVVVEITKPSTTPPPATITVSYTGSALPEPKKPGQQTTKTDIENGEYLIWTVSENPNYDNKFPDVPGQEKWLVSLQVGKAETKTTDATAVWPPRVCTTDDKELFCLADKEFKPATDSDPAKCDGGWVKYVVPARVSSSNACIYVNDINFTNYPSKEDVKKGKVDVRLQPIKTFDRSATQVGDGLQITEEWDALYFYNPTPSTERHTVPEIVKCKNATDVKQCPYEMVPDGQYPFFISARSNEPFSRYYTNAGDKLAADEKCQRTEALSAIPGTPVKYSCDIKQEKFLYATDKVTSKINVTRGPVYFLDGSTVVFPNAPQLFNTSTGPVFIPPYEINFSVSRASTVEVAVVALQPNMCYDAVNAPITADTPRNAAAGAVCKFLSTMTIANTGNFDPNVVRKIYWDGTDNNGKYVKPGIYEVRLTAKNYPDPGLYQETVKSITVNADLLKVFDLLEADGYALNTRGTDMKIGYQISVPMKVAIQIFKPGTTIYDYQKGTLRNPTTGQEVKNIKDVLVRAIVGIRPATTLIEELWDGRDYAQQEVPDGTYPFRFVTALNSADIDTVTGEILGGNDAETDSSEWKINKVADTYEYQKLHNATVAIGDGRFVCEDWEKTVFFYPNPLRDASKGTLEITKMPVPGTVSIKYFNLAGDLVRDSNYTCVDANNYQVTMGSSLTFYPDNTPKDSVKMDEVALNAFPNVRNAALRCRWDRTNQHGKKVARGVYFGLVDFKAQNGREHCQKVVKILIP